MQNKTIKQLKALLCIFCLQLFFCSSNKHSDKHPAYHTPETLETYLREVNEAYPDITYLESVGTSAEGRTIWALCISDNPSELENEPKIRLTGSIHGDENATTEVLVRLIDYLIDKYTDWDTYIRPLVDGRYIVIIPMFNPDGVSRGTRWNANDVDLNRNFSEEWEAGDDHGSEAFSEPESRAMRDYSGDLVFHSSLTFHTGAVIVNKPFDYASEHDGGDVPAEGGLVDYLALEYSESGTFLDSPGLMTGQYVDNGTINGGDWYIVNGSMQDWSYISTGCVDFTVEISTIEQDNAEDLDELFGYNRDSILAFIDASAIGAHGRVVDWDGDPIAASVTITDNNTSITGDITTHSDYFGYYHRLLLPGTYMITFSAGGYADYIVNNVEITEDDPSVGLSDIVMTP